MSTSAPPHSIANGSTAPGERALHADDLVKDLPLSENKRFYPALDGLRGLAVLMVFFHHYIGVYFRQVYWGWTGVNLFFVLSGFLITGILYDTRCQAHKFRNFYVRRSLRIFPLYYGVLLFCLLVDPIFHWVWPPYAYLLPLYLANYGHFVYLPEFIHSGYRMDNLFSALPLNPPFFLYLNHFWSLCVEEQFYLVWPLVVFTVKDRIILMRICLAALVICLVARTLCYYTLPADLIEVGFITGVAPLRVDALLLGGFLALALRGPEADWIKRLARPVLYAGLIGFFSFEITYRLVTHHLYVVVTTRAFLSTIGLTLIDLFSAAVLLRSLHPGSRIFRVFSIRPLRWLGQISYGFYVLHEVPHRAYGILVEHFHPGARYNSFYIAAVAFVGTLILSFLSFRFFEVPFLRLKDRFTV